MKLTLKFAVVIQSIALLWSCSGAPVKQAIVNFEGTSHAYGEWKSQEGFRVIINRDDTYSVCFLDDCDDGKVELYGTFGITLLDFFNKDAAVTLMNDSGFTYRNNLKGDVFRQEVDFDFSPNVPNGKIMRKHCNNRPCRIMGMQNRDYIFILQ